MSLCVLISTVYIISIYIQMTLHCQNCVVQYSPFHKDSLFRPDFRCTKIAKYKCTIQLSPSRGTLPFLYKTVFHCRRVVFCGWLVLLTVFNTAFNNNSAILWRSVLLVEETGVSEENYQPFASN